MAAINVAATWILFSALAQDTHAKRQAASVIQTIGMERETPAPTGDRAEVAVQAPGAGPEASEPQSTGWSGWLKHLVAGVSTAILVKACCLVGNVLVHVSPFSQVQGWVAKGSTGEVDPAPYAAMGLGGWQWCTYGFAAWAISNNDKFLVLVYANVLGALLGSYYTCSFYKLCRNAEQHAKLRRYLSVISSLVTLQVTLWLVLPRDRALVCHGMVAGFCVVLGACSLLACLPKAVHSGDTSGICGPLVLANFLGAVMWAYWGSLMSDPAIVGPNLFAAFSSVSCLSVKARYTSSTDECDDSACDRKLGNAWVTKRKYERKPAPVKAAQRAEPSPVTSQEAAAPEPVADAQPTVEVK